MERVEVLNGYYTDLDYDKIDKKKAIDDIYKTVKFDYNVDTTQRLIRLARIIQDNKSLFASVCSHIDIMNTIVDYLTKYAIKFDNGILSNLTEILSDILTSYESCNLEEAVITLLLTLLSLHLETEIHQFLIHPIITNSPLDFYSMLRPLTRSWNNFECIHTEYYEMIILKDSDLYAVINCLKISYGMSVQKIWIQEQVREKFLWLMKYYHNLDFSIPIHTFQLMKDIEFHVGRHTVHTVSIWSEDIVAAKNFALSLNSHVVYINTHIDLCGGIVLLPHKKILQQKTNDQAFRQNIRNEEDSDSTVKIKQSVNAVNSSHTAEMNCTSIFNLFYDGTWQKPVKGMYWKHNDNLWANATNDDILRCYESAEKGLETWGIKSMKSRIQILSKFEPILKLSGKFVLADIVARWIKFPYIYENVNGYQTQDSTLEISWSRKPLGIIILREENENVLFFRLMQTLTAGNSVIVMLGANFCNLAPYCDMFSKCGIPPGVINLLSHENMDTLEYKLCLTKYTDYANKIFVKGDEKSMYTSSYKNLTLSQHIILRLK